MPRNNQGQSGPRRIESRRNDWVKELRAGFRQSAITGDGHLAIEGQHLLEEALRSGLTVHAVFLRSGSEARFAPIGGARTLLLSPGVFSSAVPVVNSKGIAALIDPPAVSPPDLSGSGRGAAPLVVIAGGLQDPGNLGTLARSAEAFAADGIILLPCTVSPWNLKALRASSGSLFRLPCWPMDVEEAFALLRAKSIRILAAVARGGTPLEEMEKELARPCALLLGNEGAGLPPGWLEQADALVSISSPGAAESLNAAVAGSVLLYEAARQRRRSIREKQIPFGNDNNKSKCKSGKSDGADRADRKRL